MPRVFSNDVSRPKMLLAHTLQAVRDYITPRFRIMAEIRARWGHESKEKSPFANAYFRLTTDPLSSDHVDDVTWDDLELPDIFERLDTTITPIGSQVLFSELRYYVRDSTSLLRRRNAYDRFVHETQARETLQYCLYALRDEDNANTADNLFGDTLIEPTHRWPLYLWSLVLLALPIFSIMISHLIWVWLAALLINMIMILRFGPQNDWSIRGLKRCARLMNVADTLSQLHSRYPLIDQLASLAKERAQRQRLRRALRPVMMLLWAERSPIFPIPLIAGIARVAFMLDMTAYAVAAEKFNRERWRLTRTFEIVGDLDASITIASLRAQPGRTCDATFVGGRRLAMTNGRHPLIPNPVPNSISLDGQSVLITGSNMAGKTTFIKMLGINLIVAQTLGICFADAAIVPRSRVESSIRNEHSVKSGKSRYFAEVDRIRRILARESEQGVIDVIVLDEPFSGTNTVERIAITRSILEYLSHDSIVLAATHDVELQAPLTSQYRLVHFRENPDVEGYFDFLLHDGPAIERNAIRLLGRFGFPARVVGDAMKYADT